MSSEPPTKRAVVFVDGQNLFHAAREGFGYTYPIYDVAALAKQVCACQKWKLAQVRFATAEAVSPSRPSESVHTPSPNPARPYSETLVPRRYKTPTSC